VALFLVLVGGSVAAAPPLTVRHGRSIHVTINGRTEEAVALKLDRGGWRVTLGGAGAGGTLVVRDVTLGATGPRTFQLALTPEGVLLDEARFRADHAYRVELRRGATLVGSALIYLTPPKRRGPVVFDDGDAAAPSNDDELVASDKGSL
jgi:hypothetical protein